MYACYFNINVPGGPWNQTDMLGPNSSQPGDELGWDDWFGEINFYNKFPEGPRKDATYQKVYMVGGVPKDWTQTAMKHPYFMKMRDDESCNPVTHADGNWAGSRTVYIIRYAETLLTYAEAEAMSIRSRCSRPMQPSMPFVNAPVFPIWSADSLRKCSGILWWQKEAGNLRDWKPAQGGLIYSARKPLQK